MALKDDLSAATYEIFRSQWTVREGTVIPDPEDVKLSNEAVHFERVSVLYADLKGSTDLVDSKNWYFSAEIYKAYLLVAARIIKDENGVITAYDGDRIMGVFVGESQTTLAARCALKLNWAVKNIVQVEMKKVYTNVDYQIKHAVGVDTSEVRVARTGVRGDNDLVWVGQAANHAAKLTEIGDGYPSWVTERAYGRMNDAVKLSNGTPMWEQRNWNGKTAYRSSWWWKVD